MLRTIGKAIVKYQLLYALKKYITTKSMFSIIKSMAIEIKSLKFFIFAKTLYVEMYIGVNIITSPNRTESDAIQNQFPPVYKQQIPRSKHTH